MRGRHSELPLGWEETLARLRSGLEPAQMTPSRWQAVVGPAVAGLGILPLIGWAFGIAAPARAGCKGEGIGTSS